MSLTINDVRRISDLARIDLSEESAKKLMGELNDILSMVEQIQSVDTPVSLPCRTLSVVFRDFAPMMSPSTIAERKICRTLPTKWTVYS